MAKQRYKRAISINSSNQYYHPQAVECRVTFNGVELKHCITANESEGWANVYDVDEDDKLVILKSDMLRTITVKGFVKIQTPDNWYGYGMGGQNGAY